MTWNQLAALIATMPADQREKDILFHDGFDDACVHRITQCGPATDELYESVDDNNLVPGRDCSEEDKKDFNQVWVKGDFFLS